jgi:hypothetical protein
MCASAPGDRQGVAGERTRSQNGDRRQLSDTFREFGASGRVWDRAGIIAELSTETLYQIVSENFECERLSSELALFTYVCNNPTRRTLRSSLWRLEGDKWRILFHQGMVIPPA